MEHTFSPNYVRAFVRQEVKGKDEDRREITHLITTPAVDRAGDIVESAGADLRSFLSNPVVMANHSYDIASVIGRAAHMNVSRKGIMATTQFRETQLATEAYNLAIEGLGGWSIGFRPTTSHSIKDGRKLGCKVCEDRYKEIVAGTEDQDEYRYIPGRHFTEWEMLEYSSVAIPMNQEIVNDAILRGLVSREHVGNFFAGTPAEPSHALADPGPTATVRCADPHPALVREVARATRRLAYHHLAEQIDEVARGLK